MRRFRCTKSGIYCCDLSDSDSYVLSSIVSIKDQERQYSAIDVGRAKKARKLQEVMGFILEADLLRVVDHNLIRDSKVRRRDILTATDIYGKNTSILKGKTTRKTEQHVKEDALMDIPQYILDIYSSNVTLCADIMFVNGVPFFIAISRHLKHLLVVPAKIMNKATQLACVERIVAAYQHRGFTVTNMNTDNAFECLCGDLTGGKETSTLA